MVVEHVAQGLIAIVTPYGLDNYGNRLQNTAVDEILREMGFDTVTLVFRPEPLWLNNFRALIAELADRLGLRGVRSARRRAFFRFDQSLRTQTVWSESQLKRVARAAQKVVIGSDQIWNPNHIDFGGWEYGSFVDGERVVALSASFGVSEIPVAKVPQVSAAIQRIRSISVREDAGAFLVQQLTGYRPTTLVDPTLVLPRAYWEERCSRELTPFGAYMFVYALGGNSSSRDAQIRGLASARGLKVVELDGVGKESRLGAGPQHFLDFIRNAEIVITDSYHATIFSLLFGRDVWVIPRLGGEDMDSRFQMLTSRLGVKFQSTTAVVGASVVMVNPAMLGELLGNERRKVKEFLETAFETALTDR